MLKRNLLAVLMSLLAGCATCDRHPKACKAGVALGIVVLSVGLAKTPAWISYRKNRCPDLPGGC